MPRPSLTWLCLLSAFVGNAAESTTEDRKAPVRDETWMNTRMGRDAMLHSSQQLDVEGKLVDVPGRLLAVEFALGGKIVLVKTTSVLASLDAATLTLIQKSDYPIVKGGGSMHGLAVAADGKSVFISGGRTHLYRATLADDGTFKFGASIDVSGGAKNVNPLGIALAAGGKKALVALSVDNSLAVVDLVTGKVDSKVPVGIAPYGVTLSRDGQTAYVSNFGGRPPGESDHTETSAGSLVTVDGRSVAMGGTLSIVSLAGTPTQIAQIDVGLHPSEVLLSADGQKLFVANVGGDSVSVVDTKSRQVAATISTKPDPALPWGTLTDGLALSPDGLTLYTANAGVNAIGCVDLTKPTFPTRFIPAGWYPGALRAQGNELFIANVRNGLQKVTLPTTAAAAVALDTRARLYSVVRHARAGRHPLEQREAEIAFQLQNLCAEGRLRYATGFGRTTKM